MPENHSLSPHTASQKADNPQRVTPPTHIVIDPPLPVASSQPPTTAKQEEPTEKPLPRFERPEWVIVYVTVAYSFITWLTLRKIKVQADLMKDQLDDSRASSTANEQRANATLAAIEKQAKAMESQLTEINRQANLMERQTNAISEQVKLMKVPYRQWLELTDWAVKIVLAEAISQKLSVNVCIRNPTNYPITIREGVIALRQTGGHTRYEFGANTFLPPNSSDSIKITIRVSDVEWAQFNHGRLLILTEGGFIHTGALETDTRQVFSGTLECSKIQGTVFCPEVPMTPTTAEGQQSAHPEDPN
jgi:hypothetical protein